MSGRRSFCLAFLLVFALVDSAAAKGTYFEASYAASQEPGALRLPVTYTLWLPNATAAVDSKHIYSVIAVNGVELKSAPATPDGDANGRGR